MWVQRLPYLFVCHWRTSPPTEGNGGELRLVVEPPSQSR